MNVHEKYYGQAVEEIAKGIRRDDMWAKALALSEGDTKKAQALYVDLLARHFSDEASAEKSSERNSRAVSAARRVFVIAAKIVVWVLLVGGLTAALLATIDLMKEEYAKELAKSYVPESEELVPYYKVVVAIEQGGEYEDVPEYVLDSFRLGYIGLFQKYSHFGELFFTGIMNNRFEADRIYNSIISSPSGWPEEAVKKYPMEWVLLVLIYMAALVSITLALVKYPFRKTSDDVEVSPNNSVRDFPSTPAK